MSSFWGEVGKGILTIGIPAVSSFILPPIGGMVGGAISDVSVQLIEGDLNTPSDWGFAILGGAAGGLLGGGLGRGIGSGIMRFLGKRAAKEAGQEVGEGLPKLGWLGIKNWENKLKDPRRWGSAVGAGVGTAVSKYSRDAFEPPKGRYVGKNDGIEDEAFELKTPGPGFLWRIDGLSPDMKRWVSNDQA